MEISEQISALREAFSNVIVIRNCSICNYPLSYQFQGEQMYFDGGCDCVRHPSCPQPRPIADLEALLEMNPGWAEKQLERVGFVVKAEKDLGKDARSADPDDTVEHSERWDGQQ